jgi:hypothetical protein
MRLLFACTPSADPSGGRLGLAIVQMSAKRIEARHEARSPIPRRQNGLRAAFAVPVHHQRKMDERP